MYDEIVMTVSTEGAQLVSSVRLQDVGFRERDHLQEWVLAHPKVLGEGVEVVTSEYDRWQTSAGDPVADRLDVLGVDPNGRLVVAELKRGPAPHAIHMQAVNYAAMVSRLKPRNVAELYAARRTSQGQPMDVDAALTTLTSDKLLTVDSIKRPRIVLIASEFPPSVTASVVWLHEQGVEISLVRFRSYQLNSGEIVVSFSRLYPVPDVEDFTIDPRSVAPEDRARADPGAPWDEAALLRLSAQANLATLSMLDLCSVEEAETVTVKDIAQHATVSEAQVRGQLAGLTMRLRNPRWGFTQNVWPVEVIFQPTGLATYRMSPSLARLWRIIRESPDPDVDRSDADHRDPGDVSAVPAIHLLEPAVPPAPRTVVP